MAEYQYICLQCAQTYPGSSQSHQGQSQNQSATRKGSEAAAESSFRLFCDSCGKDSLLETDYFQNEIASESDSDSPSGAWDALGFDSTNPNFFRYKKWLPAHRIFEPAALPAWRKSEAIAREFGLNDLDILLSGYAPEQGSDILSTTFKEFEAYSVFSYIHGNKKDQILVVASAGNTARAFAEVALRENLAVLLVVPDGALEEIRLTLPQPENSKVLFVASTHKHDDNASEYAEAIALAEILCQSTKFFSEGGVRNVARRDGLGIGYLHAQYSRWKRDPKSQPYRYYFQAIGSGTGAIGSYSMYRRLQKAGCIAKEHQLSLMLAQNEPFIPVIEHWRERKKDFQPYAPSESLKRHKAIKAKVLANRNPPYAITGGLFDLLSESGGETFAIGNDEITAMQRLFAEKEGLDILPAAATAAAALRQAAKAGCIKDKDEPVLLHLTGGGQAQLERDFPQHKITPGYSVDLSDVQNSDEERRNLIRSVEQWFGF